MILFESVSNNESCIAYLGSNPVRFFPFGMAPQGVKTPYSTYQLVSGSPFNTLVTPNSDRHSYQVDVFSKTQSECIVAANAMRDVLQLHGYVTGYNISALEPDTRLWRLSFDIDIISGR